VESSNPIEPYDHLISETDMGWPPVRKKLTKAERQAVYEKCNGHCAYCGCEITISQMQVDHLWPISLNGLDEMKNWLPACRSCNHYKGSSPPYSFRQTLEAMTKTLARDSITYKNAVRYGQVIPNPHPVIFYYEAEGGRSE
jgi:5-methylcytosine-specific restriction endonuclease McrA